MKKNIIITDKAPAPIGPYNQAVSYNGLLFISGQIPLNPATGNMVTDSIEAETKQVMDNLQAILTEAGMDFPHVMKTTIFLTDMNDFPKVNEVYGAYFPEGEAPARETVQVSRLPKDSRVEISMIAVDTKEV
ncbi:MAG: RidA family protein [Chitinophagales bacterium]|nr:RidA family protein [Chitinophagales bacterium]